MVKIDVISGYLGSGKTTFIKKLLNALENENVVIIENEFGEIGIDGEIIKSEGYEVYELQQGCICCSIRSNFIETVDNILNEFKPDRIIIEPTGMGLLSEIISILNLPKIKSTCKINSITTIVDSENYLDQIEGFGEFFKDQIKNARKLVIGKSQFMNYQEIDKIILSLKELNNNAQIFTQNWEFMDSGDIIKIIDENIDFEGKIYRGNVESAMCGISSVGIELSKPVTKENAEKIISELKSGKYGQIMRGKGFLNIDGHTFEFNYIGNTGKLDLFTTKKDSKITIIGKNMDKEGVKALFKNL